MLERMIHEGIGQYVTFTVGAAGFSLMKVPDGYTAIVTNFTSYHFSDASTLGRVRETRVYQLTFQSGKSSNRFVIRGDIEGTGLQDDEYNVTGETKYDTYLVHTSDIQVLVTNVPRPLFWTVETGFPPPGTPTTNPPLGYGSGTTKGLTTQLAIGADPGTFMVPLTTTFTTPAAFTQGDFTYNNMGFNISSINTFKFLGQTNPAIDAGSYPIVNIGMVLLNERFSNKLQSSSY